MTEQEIKIISNNLTHINGLLEDVADELRHEEQCVPYLLETLDDAKYHLEISIEFLEGVEER